MSLGSCEGYSAIGLSAALARVWPWDPSSTELMLRTDVGLAAVALALASGAAAALSLTTGLSSVLVGVMVSVALLPPAAALGLMLGYGQPDLAIGAGLLLAINIVCVKDRVPAKTYPPPRVVAQGKGAPRHAEHRAGLDHFPGRTDRCHVPAPNPAGVTAKSVTRFVLVSIDCY